MGVGSLSATTQKHISPWSTTEHKEGAEKMVRGAEQLHFLFWKSPDFVKRQVGTVSLLSPLQKSLS